MTVAEKIEHHNRHLSHNSISSIVYAQPTSVCIRNIKQAAAHKQKGIDVHLFYTGNSPDDFYGYGNQYYASLTRVHKKIQWLWRHQLTELIAKTDAQLIHTHNEPDLLPMRIMQFNPGVPAIYDQHDFLSAKRKLQPYKEKQERYCNEKNDGAIFVTNYYRDLVAKKYRINALHMEFPNWGTEKLTIPEEKMLPKLSEKTGKVHLVYVGCLSQANPHSTRYLMSYIKTLSELGFYVDIYPSKDMDFSQYSALGNVTIHQSMPPDKLTRELTQYDVGLTIANRDVENLPEELKFGFWNKVFDYVMGGIPQITLNEFDVIRDFVTDNGIGIAVDRISDLRNHPGLSSEGLGEMRQSILNNRHKWLIESKIQVMHEFYRAVIERYHTLRLKQLLNRSSISTEIKS